MTSARSPPPKAPSRAQAAEVGSYQSLLTSLSTQMQTSLTNAQTTLANLQDVNTAQISVQLQSAQTAYQAIVSYGSKPDAGARSLQLPDMTAKTPGREKGSHRLRGPF